VFGDQHLTVEDPHQMIGGDSLDRLSGQHDRHPIPEPECDSLIWPHLGG
jgi:hypothetical protein